MPELSPQQLQQLADRLIQQRKPPAQQPVTRVSAGMPAPLTYAQEALWLVERLGTEATAYNEAVALQLEGRLDVAALQRSMAAMVERHDALRTRFVVGDDGTARQVVEPSLQLEVELIDLPELTGQALQQELQRLADRPFDLASAPLFRATLLRLSAHEHVLLWTVHHIVWDGWSANIFVAELSAYYAAFSQQRPAPALPANPLQYADFATWQRGSVTRTSLEQQRDYWRRHLAGAPALLQLPGERERPAKRTYRGAIHRFEVPARAAASLEALGRSAGATLYMTLLALFQVLLAKLSGTTDIVVRSPTSGRTHPQIAGVIGLFVNLLALRAAVQGAKPFTAHLERVKQRTLEAFGNQDFPYEWLVADLVRKRDLSYEPIAQADFVLRDAQVASGSLPGVLVRPLDALHSGAINDLTLIAQPSSAGLKCEFVYAADLFDAQTVNEFAERFVQLALRVVAAPEGNIDDIDLRLPVAPGRHAGGYPLSAAQQIRWQQIRSAASASPYDTCVSVDLAGSIDARQFAQAVDVVAAESSSLRLTFSCEAGERVLQKILTGTRVGVPFIDVSGAPDPDASAVAAVAEFGEPREDLFAAPALDCLLLRLGRERLRFCCRYHPLALDESGAIRLTRRCLEVYASLAGGEHVQPSPDDASVHRHLHEESERRYGPQRPSHRDYWRRALADSSAVSLSLRSSVKEYAEAARVEAALPAQLAGTITQRAATTGCSLAELMFAVTVMYLHRVTGASAMRVGSRLTIAAASPVACSQAVVPIVVTVDPAAGFDACLRAVLQGRHESMEHAQSYADSHAELRRGEAAFRVTIETIAEDGAGQDLTSTEVPVPVLRRARFEQDLTIRIHLGADGSDVRVAFDANSQLYEPWERQSLMAAYLSFLHSALALQQAEPLQLATLMSVHERHRLLERFCAQRMNEPATALIHEVFEQRAQLTPEAVAVVYEQEQLTYAQLNVRANRLAHHLRSHGVGPDVLVALHLSRSHELVVAVLAVLKAGGAYVPLDPTHPPERLAYILEDSAPRLLVTQESLRSAVQWAAGPVVSLDETQGDLAQCSPLDPGHEHADGGDGQLAYVIYTSGSTGDPKGVMVEHRNVTRLLAATQPSFGFSSSDTWTLFHSYGFDFSVWEMWGALLYGGRLIVVPQELTRSPEALYRLICEQQVTILNQTPSAFRQLIQAQSRSDRQHGLRHVIFGGEALDVAMLAPWYSRNDERKTRLVNMYGITETTVHVTYCEVRAADVTVSRAGSPIGTSLPHSSVYILDAQLQPVPVGVMGELYVSGGGVARGYLNRPELTRRRFLDNPFTAANGARLYRSGDLGRWRAEGTIEYLGRNDQQVKLRGFRIELGEIEARLLQHPAVREAIVTLQEQDDGDKRLIGYVTLREAATISVEELRAHLKRHLPEYMVPAAIVQLPAFPLTPNGKLDRRSLPAPDGAAYEGRGYQPPQGDTEQHLARIWCELLNVERLGRQDNFFDLGGHSLLAIQVLARVRAELGVQLPFEALFECRDLQTLAQRVETVRWSQQSASLGGAEVANQRERLVL